MTPRGSKNKNTPEVINFLFGITYILQYFINGIQNYYCALCDEECGDNITYHTQTEKHCTKYLDKHFPKLMQILNKNHRFKNSNKFRNEVIAKIVKKLSVYFGNKTAFVIDYKNFVKDKSQKIEDVNNREHLSEADITDDDKVYLHNLALDKLETSSCDSSSDDSSYNQPQQKKVRKLSSKKASCVHNDMTGPHFSQRKISKSSGAIRNKTSNLQDFKADINDKHSSSNVLNQRQKSNDHQLKEQKSKPQNVEQPGNLLNHNNVGNVEHQNLLLKTVTKEGKEDKEGISNDQLSKLINELLTNAKISSKEEKLTNELLLMPQDYLCKDNNFRKTSKLHKFFFKFRRNDDLQNEVTVMNLKTIPNGNRSSEDPSEDESENNSHKNSDLISYLKMSKRLLKLTWKLRRFLPRNLRPILRALQISIECVNDNNQDVFNWINSNLFQIELLESMFCVNTIRISNRTEAIIAEMDRLYQKLFNWYRACKTTNQTIEM